MTPIARQLWLGLMSGTSLDGVDGVAGWISHEGRWLGTAAHVFRPMPPALRDELLALNAAGANELHRAAVAACSLSHLYAEVVAALSAQWQALQGQVPTGASTWPEGVGAHGQTVRHRPELGYTLQLLNPALLVELTGLPVVADFRSRDVAAGGQGAPLVPVFHQAVLAQPGRQVVVVNIGGMANVSILSKDDVQPPCGFDSGPGNVLMDAWCQAHTGHAYDKAGAWASQGQVNADWLQQALLEPYFSLPAPKSTGRDLFHTAWLQQWLSRCGLSPDANEPLQGSWPDSVKADIQATLCELTAVSIAQAVASHAAAVDEVLVCGGGAFNLHLMARLQHRLDALCQRHVHLDTTAVRGLDPMQVEAAAFAWLAWACVHRQAGNIPAVTGARGPRVLGAIYPA